MWEKQNRFIIQIKWPGSICKKNALKRFKQSLKRTMAHLEGFDWRNQSNALKRSNNNNARVCKPQIDISFYLSLYIVIFSDDWNCLLSDELYCPYCPEKNFHCGVGLNCIPKDKICDGQTDCPNGADEKGCGKSITTCYTVCPRSSDPLYIVTYYIKWVTISWT